LSTKALNESLRLFLCLLILKLVLNYGKYTLITPPENKQFKAI